MEIRLHDSVRRQIQRHKINKWLLEAGGERVGNYYNTNGYNIPFREAVLNLWVMTPLETKIIMIHNISKVTVMK